MYDKVKHSTVALPLRQQKTERGKDRFECMNLCTEFASLCAPKPANTNRFADKYVLSWATE